MNFPDWTSASIEAHVHTHTQNSATDIAAVTTIKNLLKNDGKFFPAFSEYDKWPNIDGRFEFVPNPELSRKPEQNFFVQIKGTTVYTEKDGIVKYSLQDLSSPAFIHRKITLDPGILFVVLDPEEMNHERVFWKYMSVDFLNSIKYEQKSITIAFNPEDEIKKNKESLDAFYRKLEYIMVHHSFVSSLDDIELSSDEIKGIIALCDEEICECIDRMELHNATRDDISRRILNRLSNLAGKKTAENHSVSHIAQAVGHQKMKRVHPYLALKSATKQTGEIYFEKDTVASDESIRLFNNTLDSWERDQKYTILEDNGMVYIQHYEHRTRYILEQLLLRSQIGNKGQKEFNQKFLRDCGIQFSDPRKKAALQNIFVDSRIFLIYGAAGTGKTTLINYISRLMSNHRKLYLTNTYAALNNLKRRIESPGSDAEFISLKRFTKKISLTDYDVIFVDECSTIDNQTMETFLSKVGPDTFIVMAGDIHQIESIDFGNWFYYAKDIIQARGASVELLSTWRTNDQNLISLWDEVRKKDVCINEKLALLGPYTTDIGPEVLQQEMADEVILCLNYDGKFGLNNMNRFFQNANPNGPAVSWYEWSYKKGDRILFNDSSRFPILYNNLKGELVDIQRTSDQITFTVDVETILTEQECRGTELTLIEVHENSSRIQFTVYQHDDSADDDDEWTQMRSIIPFQLAYAVSIHKAQGLEYDSVKIIIPSNNAERITHGIFYTAITRAKKHLKIYCSSETLKTVISRIYAEEPHTRSLEIIRKKLSDS